MRFEGKTEAEAREAAAKEFGRTVEELKYRVIRDEKSFWGGRVVEIEVEGPAAATPVREAAPRIEPPVEKPREGPDASGPTARPSAAPSRANAPEETALDDEAVAAAEAALTELLSVAGFLVEIRRRPSSEEMVFDLSGDDTEPLLANKGEGLMGLEVLAGRIVSKRLGRPVHPRVDADGFRAHQKESLQELAERSAAEVKRTRRRQLLPPLPPEERRLIHIALAEDPDVETESEGDGFLKRVAVRPKS